MSHRTVKHVDNDKSLYKGVCPLCNSNNIKKLFLKEGIPYKKCRSCKFKFSVPINNPNFQDSLNEYDNTQYLEDNIADRVNYQSIVNWMNTYTDITKNKILDVGCGSGKFIRYLRNNSIEAYGIEPSKVFFDKYLSQETYFRKESIENLASKGEKYSTIVLFDVLEHLESPKRFLDNASKLLKNGGHLFLSTIDAGSVLSMLFGKQWHFYNKYHLSYFSKANIRDVCADCDLKILFIKNHGKYFSMDYIIQYVQEFLFRKTILSKNNKNNWLGRINVPLNTFEILYAVLKKG